MINLAYGSAGVAMDGQGSTIKINDGLAYGSFDMDTGAPIDPGPSHTDSRTKAEIGNMLWIRNCNRVEIHDVILDGNIDNAVLGGQWGDEGRQLDAGGIWLHANGKATVTNVTSNNHGLDGFVVMGIVTNPADPSTPHYFYNCQAY